jgi:hypothetical protein
MRKDEKIKMSILACGTCGISMLSSALPPFGFWCAFLPIAFVLYHRVLDEEGTYSSGLLVRNMTYAIVGILASAIMLAGLVIPMMFLTVFLAFVPRLWSPNKVVKKIAFLVVGAYLVSGVITMVQAKSQGDVWQLSRIKAGGPGQSYINDAAKKRLFTDDQLLELMQSKDQTVALNACRIATRRIEIEKDPETATRLYEAIRKLDDKGSLPQMDYMSDYKRAHQNRPPPEPTPDGDSNAGSQR